MRNMKVTTSSARIVTNAGAALIGSVLRNGNFYSECQLMGVNSLHPRPIISNADVIVAQIGSMCRGNVSYESINEYTNDEAFYGDALGINYFPSAETLRQRLDEIAAAKDMGMPWHDDLRNLNINLLLRNNAMFPGLNNGMIPVDGDVTPYDEGKSHKEGVSRTYKGCDGYAPLNMYLGLYGYLINTDFREGKRHSQCEGTVDFLIETIDIANRLVPEKKLLFRLDSGNDAVDNLGAIMDRGHFFIIKRNLRKETLSGWLEKARQFAPITEEPREGKKVYYGSDWKEISCQGMGGKKTTRTVRIVYEVIERTIDKNGQILLFPDVEVSTWWDNTGLSEKDVVELYHQHATMEQFHSEMKTDMGMEKLPSGKFATNMLIHELSMIAYNTLRLIGTVMNQAPEIPMKSEAYRRRIKTVIEHIIYTPAQIKTSARSITIDLGRSNVWAHVYIWINKRLKANVARCCA